MKFAAGIRKNSDHIRIFGTRIAIKKAIKPRLIVEVLLAMAV